MFEMSECGNDSYCQESGKEEKERGLLTQKKIASFVSIWLLGLILVGFKDVGKECVFHQNQGFPSSSLMFL